MDDPKTETKLQFPKGFLLGAASAAHQCEGNNQNSDWWHWEQEGRLPKSGVACDHYNRYAEDFGLAKSIGLNSVRISIEWARIEPSPGKWNSEAIDHYQKVLESLKEQGLKSAVTLWHWTLPKWVADRGGFENPEMIEAFARYVWFVAKNLGSDIDLWLTLNEPEIYTLLSYRRGVFPPFIKSSILSLRVNDNLIKAHKAAYQAIKSVYPDSLVGIAKNSPYFAPFRKQNPLDQLVCWIANRANLNFLNKIKSNLDFIGLNYYNFYSVKFAFSGGYKDMNHNDHHSNEIVTDQADRTEMGWLIYPEGILNSLQILKKFKKPIYIMESGIADGSDKKRYPYIRKTLEVVRQAMNEGADVRGFFYWALTDNFEWAHGFGPRFGLIEIDFNTLARKVRPSTKIFKEIELV